MIGDGDVAEGTAPLRVCLDDLSERRRELLLWRHALTLDYAGVDDLVRECSAWPCQVPQGPPASQYQRTAVLGTDDRYHLVIDGHPICARRPNPRRKTVGPVVYRHKYGCHWWSDGTCYRIQGPQGSALDPHQRGSRTVTWNVTLTGTSTAPDLVARGERCPVKVTLGQWPRYVGASARMGRIVKTLIDALGPDCHACRCDLGVYVDHDCFTGYVRGLVCMHCNSKVDTCPHAGNCRWADYLNNPPAAPLGLRYPKLNEALGKHQRRVDYLGIDPFADLRPAPPAALRRPRAPGGRIAE